jgi:hypothetical protein
MHDREELQRQMDALRELISRDWRTLDDPQLTQDDRNEILKHAKSCADELNELTRRLHSR